ncbi:hypothetical protein Pmani_037288 [Petrolisthes manimaculis]|uniref:Uncharacterized protein n=1 Tax=Petrolisthes manimaculis TaxID=1843537 RepID=A0AAE1TNF0_9EUCA|nr:hypothetical protein Pmani_037288 [Petrolisthes manimaculis]
MQGYQRLNSKPHDPSLMGRLAAGSGLCIKGPNSGIECMLIIMITRLVQVIPCLAWWVEELARPAQFISTLPVSLYFFQFISTLPVYLHSSSLSPPFQSPSTSSSLSPLFQSPSTSSKLSPPFQSPSSHSRDVRGHGRPR